jgi:acetyl-CoA synthetase
MKIDNFWLTQSNLLQWVQKPSFAYIKKKNNYVDWYPDGKINIFDNCITRNIELGLGKKIAIHCISKNKEIKSYTYEELNKRVNSFSSILISQLKNKNVSYRKVMIHASASLESSISMLSCIKLGIHFSVIFEDLAPEAISKRISLFKPDIFLSSFTKKIFKKNIFKKIKLTKKIKFLFFEELKYLDNKKNINIKSKVINGSKEMFTLFTSGSTGVPKGITHASAGYMVYTKYTCKHQFGMNRNSIILTASDAGWLNGHTYALFGPLSFGATAVLIEKPMLLIDDTFLKKILKLKITILYLPVTLIRLMKAIFKEIKFQTKYLTTLGSMGEHIAPSVAEWFAKSFTNKNKPIVNAYYQTENGAIIASPTYKQKISQVPHGSAGKLASKYLKINKLYKNKKTELKILTPWPGCMKSILNGNKEWKKYWDKSNNFRMFDLATIKNKNIFIHGRTDDVINIRGHRIGSEEIESIVLGVKEIYECCAISILNDLEGHVIYLFLVSKNNQLNKEIKKKIVSNFGAFALPKEIYYINELPKTRSGKILRRLLRSILVNPYSKNYGDLSTMLNSKVIKDIKEKIVNNVKN